MKEFDFYDYYENFDKIKIYSDNIQKYFESNFNIIVDGVDFDQNQNVILYTNNIKDDLLYLELEKKLLNDVEHLNRIEIKKTKIILTFDSAELELC